MKTKETLLSSYWILMMFCVYIGDGYCFGGRATIDAESRRPVCVVKEGVIMAVGEKRKFTDECLHCSCNTSGYRCCGYGIGAGHFAPPRGYRLVLHPPCDYSWEPEDPPRVRLTYG